MTGRRLISESEIDRVLEGLGTVVIVGLSPRPSRPSHRVAKSLQSEGVRIIPVHPGGGSILDEPVYSRLGAIPDREAVDVINVFRRPEALPDLVEEIVAAYPEAGPRLWFQFGVTHPEAESRAQAAGFDLVVDRCLLVEHLRWRSAGS